MGRLHSNDTGKDEGTKKVNTIIEQDKRDNQNVRNTNQKSTAESGLV